eukprot:4554170-Pleurochrysis_carterae.AAC.1
MFDILVAKDDLGRIQTKELLVPDRKGSKPRRVLRFALLCLLLFVSDVFGLPKLNRSKKSMHAARTNRQKSG